jgi:hypothetical protein
MASIHAGAIANMNGTTGGASMRSLTLPIGCRSPNPQLIDHQPIQHQS